MKTSLSLGLMLAALGTFAGCSSDEGETPRGGAGTGTLPGGGSGGQTASAGTGGGGGTPGTGGTGGTGSANVNLGAALTITAEGNVIDEAGGTGIDGGQAISQSTTMTEPAVLAPRAGGLCIKGTTATVPDGDSYGTHWGAQLGLDLKRIPDPNGAPAPVADAGADAGGDVELIGGDWEQGNVIGFAYTLVGNNEALPDKGVPGAHFRFKAMPAGGSDADDNYCDDRAPISGQQEVVLFSDITFECWTPGNYTLAEDPIQFVETPDPNKVVGTRANPHAFRNIAWQIASDLLVDPIEFDFCVTDLRPVLAAP